MASQQEIQQIITNFLLNAPPGEFMEVVTDIRGLLKNDAILNSLAPTVFKQYNTDQMLKVKTPYNTEFLITKQGEVSANEYLDPATKQIVTFDHIRQEITGARSAGNALDSDVEPYRYEIAKSNNVQVTDTLALLIDALLILSTLEIIFIVILISYSSTPNRN
jgi:hypothetical protein